MAGYLATIDAALDDAARAKLARDPQPPRDPGLFTSNALFGEPGIYPQGSPMEPAAEPPMSAREVRDELTHLVPRHAVERLDDHVLVDAVPDLAIRAALVVLTGTIGEPVLDAFPAHTTASCLAWGAPSSPGRVVGPADDDVSSRVVNERYHAEHFALVAPSLVHDLLWTPETSGHAAEALLHACVAMVHLQLVARAPRLAHLGTELARRQNSLAITLLNSRHSGSARISLIAPDGTGTIPGGAPSMQTPDFWSIPFAQPLDAEAPTLLGQVLERLVDPSIARPTPLRFDNRLASWIDAHHDDRWLSSTDRLRVTDELGLTDR